MKIFRFFCLGLIVALLSSCYSIEHHPLDRMPRVKGVFVTAYAGSPVAKRGKEYRRFLAPSIQIATSHATGSGTIVYHDLKTNTAYVATCGHLWPSGERTAKSLKGQNVECTVIVWYHNNKKLDKPKRYKAQVKFWTYFYNNTDTGLVTFQPDWLPEYFCVAPLSYNLKKGGKYHSTGCDYGQEVAHYDVKIRNPNWWRHLITENNNPRPGRSGGGLMSDDGYYVGTCWGTEQFGYFTPLSIIHKVWKKNGYGWLLEAPKWGLAQDIPIYDARTGQRIPKSFILIPGQKE